MERKVMHKLVEWRERKDRKPLILKGARQVGKTYILKEFGMRYFKNTVYINCDNDPTARGIISKNYDISRILFELSVYCQTEINAADTLIIIDEIQEVPKGLHLLKYFCEDAPQYFVAVAGSTLGITLHQGESFPVGKVDIIEMFPLTFTEFLIAKGKEQYATLIEACDWNAINDLLPDLTLLLRQYYFVGGMPEIVKSYLENPDAMRIREKQKNILMTYQNDMSKHAPTKDIPRINQIWQSIPSQLAKENKKFIYGAIRKGARAAEYEVAIQWLLDAGLIYKVNRLNKVGMPLSFYIDIAAFKLFVLDCGLLGAMSNAPAEMMLASDNVFVEFKGAFTEQYVMQQFKAGVFDDICYYTNESGTQEIDFVVQLGSNIIPIEAKAEVNVKSKSFTAFLTAYPELQGIRLSMRPFRKQERFSNLPLPCASGIQGLSLPVM